jgi:hypothetical protein
MEKLRTLRVAKMKILKSKGLSLSLTYIRSSILAVKQDFPKPWHQSLIVPIFKNGDINIPSNYRTIMISPILAKIYGTILENKISLWLKSHDKRVKGKDEFRIYHSTMDHLVTFRIIAEEFHNTKTNRFCCFVDFRKDFHMVPRKTFG